MSVLGVRPVEVVFVVLRVAEVALSVVAEYLSDQLAVRA